MIALWTLPVLTGHEPPKWVAISSLPAALSPWQRRLSRYSVLPLNALKTPLRRASRSTTSEISIVVVSSVVAGSVGSNVGGSVGSSVGASVGDSVGASVGASVGGEVGRSVGLAVPWASSVSSQMTRFVFSQTAS